MGNCTHVEENLGDFKFDRAGPIAHMERPEPMHPTLDTRDTVCVVRQPILDSAGRVFGYELLYREDAPEAEAASEDLATARVITDAVLSLGLDTLTDGLPAFIPLSRELLVRDSGTLLPPASTVLELPEGLVADADVLAACKKLHGLGYKLALHGAGAAKDFQALLPFAKFVKVDATAIAEPQRSALPAQLAPVQVIANRVETFAAARELQAAGYALFQGYYFCKPDKVGTDALPGRRLAYLNLLTALNKPDVKDRLLASGAEIVGGTPQEFMAMRNSEMARLGKLIKEAGIRAD